MKEEISFFGGIVICRKYDISGHLMEYFCILFVLSSYF